MKICIAQTRPAKGDIEKNIENHIVLIEQAVAKQGELIVFPELSITGYEPDLAKSLATIKEDSRLDVFQSISDKSNIIICVGIPTLGVGGIHISIVIFQPNRERELYSKQHLHADELPYFIPGNYQSFIVKENIKIAPAICYELTVPEHSFNAHQNNTTVYLTSVAKSSAGADRTHKTLSELASKYSMITVMSNSVGPSDNFIGGGKSAVWDVSGNLIEQLDGENEGLLVYRVNR